ncbi:hypothetical protein Vafri_14547, partial [Volvox africanus]
LLTGITTGLGSRAAFFFAPFLPPASSGPSVSSGLPAVAASSSSSSSSPLAAFLGSLESFLSLQTKKPEGQGVSQLVDRKMYNTHSQQGLLSLHSMERRPVHVYVRNRR